jgi:ribosomal protein RSM22 (predicted rRNA methylase)
MEICESLEASILAPLLTSPYEAHTAMPHHDLLAFVPHLERLSKQYQERFDLEAPISEAAARAYAAYYGIINSYKCMHLFSHLPHEFQPATILDFGAGCGTATIAASIHFKAPLIATHIEVSDGMRAVARHLVTPLVQTLSIKTQLAALHPDDAFDLVVAANSLNELSQAERIITVQTLIARCQTGGYIVLLEPGTQQASADLVMLREQLLAHKHELQCTITYPCFHEQPCALLAHGNGWCHSEFFLERSTCLRQMDHALGYNKHTVSFSALILRKQDPLQTVAPISGRFRVIEEAKKNKVGSSAYLCGASYQGPVTLRKRDRNDENRQFEKLKMHDETVWYPELIIPK